MKRNADPDILFPHDRFGRPPVGWVIESPTTGKVYMTEKREVAEKRYKAQDHVTPYHSKLEPALRDDALKKAAEDRKREEEDEL